MKKCLYILACAALAACSAWEDHFPVPEELGLPQDEFILPADESSVQVEYLSNMSGSIISSADWIRLDAVSFRGDGSFTVSCPRNDGFPRVGSIILKADGSERADTAVFKQYGSVEPLFALASTSCVLYNSNGQTVSEVPVTTNLQTGDFDIEIMYTGGTGGWILGVEIKDGKLTVSTRDNTSKTTIAYNLFITFITVMIFSIFNYHGQK